MVDVMNKGMHNGVRKRVERILELAAEGTTCLVPLQAAAARLSLPSLQQNFEIGGEH